jgi:hypothetical protein
MKQIPSWAAKTCLASHFHLPYTKQEREHLGQEIVCGIKSL